MPRQFYVRAIYRTSGLCMGTNHEDQTFLRNDVPEGTILAVDKTGEWYIYRGPGDQNFWPKPTEHGIQLFRDYWRCACTMPDASSPNDRAIISVPKRLIAGKKGDQLGEPGRRKR